MTKITNNFILGNINRDADERLIPNGSVRKLENAIIVSSEGDDKGSIENPLANKLLSDLSLVKSKNPLDIVDNSNLSVTNPVVLKAVANQAKNKIYYFIKSNEYDLILEYNVDTEKTEIVLQTTQGSGLLNFDKPILNADIIIKSSVSEDKNYFNESDAGSVVSVNLPQESIVAENAQVQFAVGQSLTEGATIRLFFKLEDFNNNEYFREFKHTFKSTSEISAKERFESALNAFLLSDNDLLEIEPNTGKLIVFGGNSIFQESLNTVNVEFPVIRYSTASGFQYNGFKVVSCAFSYKLNNEDDSDLIAFSGDDNPPRIINVERCKNYLLDEILSTDLNLIKRPPIKAPIIEPYISDDADNELEDKFISFAYRFVYKDGYFSAKSSSSEYAFLPTEFNVDFDTYENLGMSNVYNAVVINYETGDENVEAVELLFRESNSQNWKIIETINKDENNLSNNSTESFNFTNNKIYRVLPNREYNRVFDNVPLKSVAQCYANNKLFFGNYNEQRNLVDANGDKCKIDFSVDVESIPISDVVIPTSGGTSLAPREIVFDLSNVDFQENNTLVIDFSFFDDSYNISYQSSLVYVLPDTINSASDLVQDSGFQSALQSFKNKMALEVDRPPNTSGFSQNFGAGSFSLTLQSPTEIGIEYPRIFYSDSGNTTTIVSTLKNSNTSASASSSTGSSSMKSNRTYEVVQLYLDEEGRRTTGLDSLNNTTFVDISKSASKNVIKVTIPSTQKPPAWAKYYKFAIKKTRDWETLYSNIFYVDGNYRWIKLEGSDVNKVNVGDDVVFKRDADDRLESVIKVKILDKQTFGENFLDANVDENGDEIIEERGTYIKIKPRGLFFDYADDEFVSYSAINRTEQGFPSLVIDLENPSIFANLDASGNFVSHKEIKSGTVFDFKEIRNRRGDTLIDIFSKRFVANQDYNNVRDFMNQAVPKPENFITSADVATNGTLPLGGFQSEADPNDIFYFWVERGKFTTGSTNLLRDQNGVPLNILGFGFELDNTEPYRLIIRGTKAGSSTKRSKLNIEFVLRSVDGLIAFEKDEKVSDEEIFYETPETYDIINNEHEQQVHNLNKAFNCFSQGNGVESVSYKDQFNENKLVIDFSPTSVSQTEYRKLNRFADITFCSSDFNDNSGINGLNEFNLSTANFKDDIEKSYGSIQKLFSRDTNIIVGQEDKMSYVLVGKTQIFNADGTTNVSTTENVLGQQVPYAGEYGISKDPRSFASNKNYIYFSDKKRGVVCRLGSNGIFEISSDGFTSFFRNLFAENTIDEIIGCYDEFNDIYFINVKYNNDYITVGYKNSVNQQGGGWVTEQFFNPEEMITYDGNFVSFDNGNLYLHNDRESGIYNRFYGQDVTSKVKFIFSQEPYQRKVYKTLETDGTDAWKATLETNLQKGLINLSDFRYQEGVYRNYIRTNNETIDYSTLSVQGIGNIESFGNNNVLFFNQIPDDVSVGDLLLNENGDSTTILNIINTPTTKLITVTDDDSFTVGEYVFSAKNQNADGSGILGYYMGVELELSTNEKTELFSVSSEVFMSNTKT